MPTIKLNGRGLYYAENGAKDSEFTLLFIHGASSSSAVWTDEIKSLIGCRVIALDLPGHGRSDPPGRRTVAHYASVVEDFIRTLGPNRPILVGHSMGSAIALTLAHRSVVPVRGLILLGASARMPVGTAILMGAMTDLQKVASYVAEFGLAQVTVEWQEEICRQVIATGGMTTYGDYMACNRFDLRPTLSTIGVPALFIAGRQDNMVPLRFSESTATAMPNARIVVLDDTGHYAMIEKPQAVLKLVTEFLRDLAQTTF